MTALHQQAFITTQNHHHKFTTEPKLASHHHREPILHQQHRNHITTPHPILFHQTNSARVHQFNSSPWHHGKTSTISNLQNQAMGSLQITKPYHLQMHKSITIKIPITTKSPMPCRDLHRHCPSPLSRTLLCPSSPCRRCNRPQPSSNSTRRRHQPVSLNATVAAPQPSSGISLRRDLLCVAHLTAQPPCPAAIYPAPFSFVFRSGRTCSASLLHAPPPTSLPSSITVPPLLTKHRQFFMVSRPLNLAWLFWKIEDKKKK
jgi:hypothetical protein